MRFFKIYENIYDIEFIRKITSSKNIWFDVYEKEISNRNYRLYFKIIKIKIKNKINITRIFFIKFLIFNIFIIIFLIINSIIMKNSQNFILKIQIFIIDFSFFIIILKKIKIILILIYSNYYNNINKFLKVVNYYKLPY